MAQRIYTETPPWRDETTLLRLSSMGWRLQSAHEETRPHHAGFVSDAHPGFEITAYHSRDSKSGQRYHSFVPVRLRTGRGVNFLTMEGAIADVQRRDIRG